MSRVLSAQTVPDHSDRTMKGQAFAGKICQISPSTMQLSDWQRMKTLVVAAFANNDIIRQRSETFLRSRG